MNVTVIRGKDLLKVTIGLICFICLLVMGSRFFTKSKNYNIETKINIDTGSIIYKLTSKPLLSCIDTVLPIIAIEKKEEKHLITENKFGMKGIFNVSLGMMDNIKNLDSEVIQNEEETSKELELAKTDVTTEVVSDRNITANYTNTNGKIEVKNRTNYEITEDLMQTDYSLDNNHDILIFHTHTCESYTQSEEYDYQMTGNYRTTDLNYSVVRVGDELESQLEAYGYNVIHDKTYHDYPSYTGSYSRSLATVENVLSQNQGIQAIFDIHRDAVGNGDDYGPTVKIGDDTVAQLMFVLGTDASGLLHPNWRQNFKFAANLQEKGNQMYPGLFRPINLTSSRYNQQVSPGAVIIEVGATANTMEECLGSMKYLAKVISEVMK